MRVLSGLENVGARARAGSACGARSRGAARRPRAARRAAVARVAVALAATLTAAALAGCGSGSSQDAGEPSGVFPVRITHASFPPLQSIARPASLVLTVNNAGTRTIPNVAVSLKSLYYTSNYPGLADRRRPIWVIERGPGVIPQHPVESEAVAPPGGGQTAYVETWALGPLKSGASATFHWLVTPVRSGLQRVHYVVAAGLAGNAKARFPSGRIPQGAFTVHIAPRPRSTHVNPETGTVTPGPYRPSS